ncbi:MULTISPECIES: uracil-DNA glycosylase [unclassified Mycolicibacterium]|uniref:uracil-DNA glycosylase n=1 Tax=unclassified Mycolicibacterium TaxID=2636767 RepID=UPI0012DC8288|nr:MULTISPECIES: uracil-DNA glycosylase [unclassified Mycolicibacterium]MUL84911.1 uracil-DNA glycosylase [Mycolicibacterium sp. CBMA 329]MUL90878.1 uracil-DNA glycosylase [Mycolicibacterium sp. CBMA 331]MUM01826.1 uracil-DNA glycosylase [Mycolicibacterium sp. CBMA 334]MUM29255.1 uracil-DNA glycosylase [Mycolicibacterium sp. CBMA 295]MUM40637.1 uracil-DNA glycosylase [Mycolicibacterium sp. CBMA 247]
MELAHPRTGELFTSPVPPGSGWPGDLADATTPVAKTAAQVRRLAARAATMDELDALISVCRACPRLVAWREEVAVAKRKSFADQPYWGRPATGFGSVQPGIMIVGLAPAAHGANRTGRVFTGDRSGDFLLAALHRAGLANQALCVDAADGMQLIGTRMAGAVRCAPPANAPTPAERATCAPWLHAEWRLVGPSVHVVIALGGFAWRAALELILGSGTARPKPAPKFGHGATATLTSAFGPVTLLGCFHPSQQNTFTGRLTEAMLDDIFTTAKHLVAEAGGNEPDGS